jgi:hypothetical protein
MRFLSHPLLRFRARLLRVATGAHRDLTGDARAVAAATATTFRSRRRFMTSRIWMRSGRSWGPGPTGSTRGTPSARRPSSAAAAGP